MVSTYYEACKTCGRCSRYGCGRRAALARRKCARHLRRDAERIRALRSTQWCDRCAGSGVKKPWRIAAP